MTGEETAARAAGAPDAVTEVVTGAAAHTVTDTTSNMGSKA